MIPKLKGSHPWALILCYASDHPAPDWPQRDYFNALIALPSGNGLYTWWQQISGGNLDLAGSQVFGWYRLAKTVTDIGNMGREEIVATARAAASTAGSNLSSFNHTLAVMTKSPTGGNVGSDVVSGFFVTNGQPGWRWCAKCEGMAYWDGSREPGRCSAGGHHDHSRSSLYAIPRNTSFPDGQGGWRWCNKCEMLFFAGNATSGQCPAGGMHLQGSSTQYVLRKNSAGENEQKKWCWCKKCNSLAFYDGSRDPGKCPAGGSHDHLGSGDYSVPYAWAPSLGFLAHETGHGFGLDHAFGPNRQGDLYNDSRPGAYGDWTDIMSFANTATFEVPFFTPAGAGLSAPTLYKLGWLSDSETTTIVSSAPSQSFTLRPLYGDAKSNNPRMIRVVEPKQDRIYAAEYRVPLNWDTGLQTARVVIHTMPTLYQVGQDGWRHCDNCEGLIYAGQTVCPAGGVHDGNSSNDYWLSLDAGSGAGQNNWRWCHKCCGLFFAGNAAPGICPAGGNHDGSQSGNYSLLSSGGDQSNWKWCNKCQGLVFAGNSTPGICPAGGLHNHSGSANYVIYTGSGTKRQNKWRWCNKCQGLYYAGLGSCKGGDIHKLSGDDYALAHKLTGGVGQAGWRFCRKCFGLAFNDGSRSLGACPAGGTHDHSTSGDYVIPRDAEAKAGQQNWRWCNKCSSLHYVDPKRSTAAAQQAAITSQEAAITSWRTIPVLFRASPGFAGVASARAWY